MRQYASGSSLTIVSHRNYTDLAPSDRGASALIYGLCESMGLVESGRFRLCRTSVRATQRFVIGRLEGSNPFQLGEVIAGGVDQPTKGTYRKLFNGKMLFGF